MDSPSNLALMPKLTGNFIVNFLLYIRNLIVILVFLLIKLILVRCKHLICPLLQYQKHRKLLTLKWHIIALYHCGIRYIFNYNIGFILALQNSCLILSSLVHTYLLLKNQEHFITNLANYSLSNSHTGCKH